MEGNATNNGQLANERKQNQMLEGKHMQSNMQHAERREYRRTGNIFITRTDLKRLQRSIAIDWQPSQNLFWT